MKKLYVLAAIVCVVLAARAIDHGDWKASAIFFADAAIFCIARQLCTPLYSMKFRCGKDGEYTRTTVEVNSGILNERSEIE